jgi:hypothetical protein
MILNAMKHLRESGLGKSHEGVQKEEQSQQSFQSVVSEEGRAKVRLQGLKRNCRT